MWVVVAVVVIGDACLMIDDPGVQEFGSEDGDNYLWWVMWVVIALVVSNW